MNQITLHQSAVVFIDYNGIYEALHRYGIDPVEINFFPAILDHLKNTQELDVIEAIIYANFDMLPARHQTYLRQLGLTTRHCNEKHHINLILAIDAVTLLHENPNIDVFVLITGSNSIIELLKTIRYKNKFAYCLTLKENFDPTILSYSDFHEYLDDILGFKPQTGWKIEINRSDLTIADIKWARKIARLFYDSHIWRKFEETGETITLSGYLAALSKAVNVDIFQLRKAFELAHLLRYVTIYPINDVLYLQRGERYKKVMKTSLKQEN